MNVYIYAAALYCEECGEEIRAKLTAEGGAPVDIDDESSYDSDDFPKGPFPDGGGEADSPQHCDKCSVHLENDLTEEGQSYVREACAGGKGACVDEWATFYGVNRIMPSVYETVGCEPGSNLPAYTSIGCYTIVYYAEDMSDFCAKCAKDSDTGEKIVAAEVYWEGPDRYCLHCNKVIESSYGDSDALDTSEMQS